MQNNQWSVYMRTSFTLSASQLSSISNLQLTVDYDDGYIAFLNGSEISRGSMGGFGAFRPHNQGSAEGHGASTDNGGTFNPTVLSIPTSALQVGENVLSGQVHNFTIGSSDLILYMALSADGSVLVPANATYSYFIGSSEPPGAPSALTPHGITQDPAGQDQDGNGLPDLWEALYSADGISPLADSDGDGMSNLQESRFGTDPFDPTSKMAFQVSPQSPGNLMISWTALSGRPGVLETSPDLGDTAPWTNQSGTPSSANSNWNLTVPMSNQAQFFRLKNSASDLDNDGVPDWLEPLFGFSNAPGDSDSAYQGRSYDTDGNGSLDTSVTGDLAAFNEIYRIPQIGESLTRAQSARLLLQTTFGPSNMAQVDYVASIGAEAWLDEQIAIPPTLTQPYIEDIKTDLANGQPSSTLSGYNINATGATPYVAGTNYMTAWLRSALRGQDQLRQRVAFALSQIIVASRSGAGLPNQPRSAAHYYDFMLNGAFGNYEDLLLQVSLSPYMGTYLSHIANEKADPSIGRYPDENYAREIMQLFTIGLWELHSDGTRKLDASGEPIPTYDNLDITALAKVFTGMNYAANFFGGGWRDDGDSPNQWMTTPMKAFASHHDFSSKNIPMGIDASGNRIYHTIPARSGTDGNALQDVKDLVSQLVKHPNTAPFVSRQLIQFLVTSNPSPPYVARVASVFSNDGSGVTGNLEAVVKAILLDQEARNPLNHLKTSHFGHFREPTLRTVHLARILKLDRHSDVMWWDWGYYRDHSLQEPMHSPSVFNFYRPDYRLFGDLAAKQLDSPALGIVNSYSSISFANYLWKICQEGLQHPNGQQWWDNKTFPPDWTELVALANNIPDLLDHLSILYCAGTLGAESRATISDILATESSLAERARLAAFLVLISPEGTCLK